MRIGKTEDYSQAIFLTGRRGIGKTTICQAVAELARRRGYRPAGVITPALCDDHGVKMGFEAMDVGRGERWLLARTDRELGGPRVGPYSFDPIALTKAIRVLRRAATSGIGKTVPCDLFMVDEIGPLELEQGEGFAPILDSLPVEGPTHTLIVVRPAFLGQLLLCLGGTDFTAFSVTEENRDALPLQIVDELWKG